MPYVKSKAGKIRIWVDQTDNEKWFKGRLRMRRKGYAFVDKVVRDVDRGEGRIKEGGIWLRVYKSDDCWRILGREYMT